MDAEQTWMVLNWENKPVLTETLGEQRGPGLRHRGEVGLYQVLHRHRGQGVEGGRDRAEEGVQHNQHRCSNTGSQRPPLATEKVFFNQSITMSI